MTTSFMNEALIEAKFSDDSSTQNGAVIVREGRIIGRGNNNFPYGVIHTEERWERPTKYKYVEHAERNAIYDAARMGQFTVGSEMYCVWSACADCARGIAQSGIDSLIRLELPYEHWADSVGVGDIILKEANVRVINMPLSEVDIPDLRFMGGQLSDYK